jgi:hypothetical protein
MAWSALVGGLSKTGAPALVGPYGATSTRVAGTSRWSGSARVQRVCVCIRVDERAELLSCTRQVRLR